MIVFEKWKIMLISAVIMLSAALAVPNLMPRDEADTGFIASSRINLGLDLQGGSYLLLKVEMDEVLKERLSNMAEAIRADMREERIGIRNLRSDDMTVSFDVRKDEDRPKAREIFARITGTDMAITANGNSFSSGYTEDGLQALSILTVGQAIEIVRNRIDETGTKEPIIQRQGRDRILIQLPGVDNPEDVKRLLGKTARLGFQMVDITTTAEEAQASGRIPAGSEILGSYDDSGELYLVRKRVLITGDMLDDARPAIGQNNDPVVSFNLNPTGGARFGKITGANIGRPFAIVLDDKVVSAPGIRGQIFSEGQISGDFTIEESDELALLLRAGALPAPLSVLEERSVGPGLGSDSIEAGKIASIIGLIAVVIFMVASYGQFGVLAVVALTINIIILVAALSAINATLTLPGIAGIVLTIGMAVDANVLIFERIREDLKRGKKIVSSVNSGFKQATATIIDANLTTLAAAFCLYLLGSGPIKGFSVTLAIGVLTSMFTAVMVTRMLVVLWLNRRRPKTLVL
ncbi:MAG: protein translocase subunit SecD [Alphaproteobacteria bacterium]|nr:protein translocase subunit SecD [Alphaproteobacteria bacterium]